ncbi:TadE/TadG family type IV pilus assembly protein [Streptomyces inusitatus]|uniref:TadE/TadG family type IV pilus assembly protein n=1 Tax=Streptomyces inusitatus TaxID=68221 RepID=UPI00167CA917|nr:TadE/TadG family type IV pilus assembly protein [Streptomyces inusitatus]
MRSHVRAGRTAPAPAVAPGWARLVRARLREDRGQAAVEFTGTLPVILATLALLWQAALIGYSFSLAGNAADAGARAGAVDGPAACEAAAREDLPAAWLAGARFGCPGNGGDLYEVSITFSVPVLFPGVLDLPFTFDADAAAVNEVPS